MPTLLLSPIPDSNGSYRVTQSIVIIFVPYSLLPTPYSLLPTPYSLFPIPCSLFPFLYHPLQPHHKKTIHLVSIGHNFQPTFRC
ncbi:MAG: hypothetical protein F6K56_12500 [Moorea sp. SIO3G5]|nr:hypothetical protein [Moorena sp. SIO3G5]